MRRYHVEVVECKSTPANHPIKRQSRDFVAGQFDAPPMGSGINPQGPRAGPRRWPETGMRSVLCRLGIFIRMVGVGSCAPKSGANDSQAVRAAEAIRDTVIS